MTNFGPIEAFCKLFLTESGRRRDLTVPWTLKQLGDVHQTVEVLEMDRTPAPQGKRSDLQLPGSAGAPPAAGCALAARILLPCSI
jgi:hypothetical protein